MRSIWDHVPLSELCEIIQYGYTASASSEPVGPRFLRITDIVPDHLSWEDVPYCEIDSKSFAKYQLVSGDIVVARTGATVGYAKYLRSPPRAVFASYLVRLRINDEHEARYIGRLVESGDYKTFIKAHAGGAAQPNANAKVLTSFPVPVPPLDIQRKIAAVLAEYEELIENNLRRIEILDEIAQAIYREWFVSFRYPGHEADDLVDSPLGPIPERFTERTMEELGDGPNGVIGGPFGSKLGRKDYVSSGVPVIRGVNLNGALGFNYDGLAFVSDEKFLDLRGNSAKPGDIIVTQRGTLGQVGLIPESSHFDRYVVSQSQMRLTVDPMQAAPLFVYQTLRWPSVNRRLVDHAMAAGVPHINLGILRAFKIVVPPPEVAFRFDHLVRPGRRLMENLARQNDNLRKIRDLLLPKLVSGKIDVSDLDIDTSWLAA